MRCRIVRALRHPRRREHTTAMSEMVGARQEPRRSPRDVGGAPSQPARTRGMQASHRNLSEPSGPRLPRFGLFRPRMQATAPFLANLGSLFQPWKALCIHLRSADACDWKRKCARPGPRGTCELNDRDHVWGLESDSRHGCTRARVLVLELLCRERLIWFDTYEDSPSGVQEAAMTNKKNAGH